MKIDIFPHILPAKYKNAVEKEIKSELFSALHEAIPTLLDLNYRFRIMDKFDGLMQVLTIVSPPVENIADRQKALNLARLANDEMAELVLKYPDRFAAAVACLPMNNVEAALDEVDRAINDLNFRGVQIFTPINDKPLDSQDFFPLYEKMSQYNLPIWIHPQREMDYPDYRSEETSLYEIHATLGWVYETSSAMIRLVLSGILEKYPNLKFITHHAGAMIPFLEKRLAAFIDGAEVLRREKKTRLLRRPTLDYFRMFYADTAICGSTPGLMCSYAFFGAHHLLFGTDMPFDTQYGLKNTRETIESINRMAITDVEKKMIFEDNTRALLRLSIV